MTIEELKNTLKENLKVYTYITYSDCNGHEVHTIVKFADEIISETIQDAEIINY